MRAVEQSSETHLEMPFSVEEQILRLDVTVSYTLTVQIGNAACKLLEAALNFAG